MPNDNSKKVIEMLIDNIKASKKVTVEEHTNFARLKNKRKACYDEFLKIQEYYKRNIISKEDYEEKYNYYYKELDELNIEINSINYDFDARASYKKRLDLIKIILKFNNNNDIFILDGTPISFKKIYYTYVDTVKNDAIEQLNNKIRLDNFKIVYNKRRKVEPSNKYYLNDDKLIEMTDRIPKIRLLIDDIGLQNDKNLDLDNISFTNLIQEDPLLVYNNLFPVGQKTK